jgi:hypothetical protein
MSLGQKTRAVQRLPLRFSQLALAIQCEVCSPLCALGFGTKDGSLARAFVCQIHCPH